MMDWMNDERAILTVVLAAMPDTVFSSLAGASFERFERPGEYCFLPWIRVQSPTGNVIEAPLTQVQMLAYSRDSGSGSKSENSRSEVEGEAPQSGLSASEGIAHDPAHD